MAKCNIVTVVFAYEIGSSPWIYGTYKDNWEAWKIKNEMQQSDEFGSLIWDTALMNVE